MRIGKFALVGLTGLVVGETLLYVFTEFFGIFYVFSGVIAVELCVIINFFMHEKWTFIDRKKKGRWIKRLAKYNVISLAGMAINTALLFAFTEFLKIHYLISNILAAFVVFNWNYFVNLRKTWRYDKQVKTPEISKNPLVSIVIPTYNEKENIGTLVPKIFDVLGKNRMKGEVVVVDDNSYDGTGETAEKMKARYRMKVIHRKGKLGLSSAVIEGIEEAEGEIIGVMDADLSHPPEMIPELIKPIISDQADITVGSRYIGGGKIENWPLRRRIISRGASLLAKLLTSVKDPASGFFFFKTGVIKDTSLKPYGYKIGLEIFVKSECSRIKEIPYTFVDRKMGKSKLGAKEDIAYLKHLIKLYWYKVNR